jgi:predicted O-linked N-acetylglucosamine transferase (SPINDLY family)
MRILKAVDGSVLCLIADSEMGKRNLKKEANKRGIKKERLIFINRMNYERYLNLYSITNLFLDTYNYNAGTTASDALWCGLPILTMKGESFASSMASSLLNAIGIKEELITYNSKDYEEKAINLAKNPEKLEQLKKIIIQNRKTSPLFDTNKFTKNLEKTYLKILKIQ